MNKKERINIFRWFRFDSIQFQQF